MCFLNFGFYFVLRNKNIFVQVQKNFQFLFQSQFVKQSLFWFDFIFILTKPTNSIIPLSSKGFLTKRFCRMRFFTTSIPILMIIFLTLISIFLLEDKFVFFDHKLVIIILDELISQFDVIFSIEQIMRDISFF